MFSCRPSTRGLREYAQLLRHAEIVAIRKVIGDFSIAHPVPVNVLDLEAFACRFDASQETAIDSLGADSQVRTADATSNNN